MFLQDSLFLKIILSTAPTLFYYFKALYFFRDGSNLKKVYQRPFIVSDNTGADIRLPS